MLGGLYAAYELGRGAQGGNVTQAVARGRAVLSWERWWHVSPELSLNHAVSQVTPLAVLAAYYYSTLHYVVTPAVLVWLYRSHRAQYRSARTSIVIGTALGLVGYYLLPMAPPRLLTGSGITDTLADVQRWGWWGGEGSVPRGLGSLTNQFAAMPSLHVGWALWSGVLIARYASRAWVRRLGAVYPVATTIVVLATGNHYLLDAVGGAAVMVLGWSAQRVLRRRPDPAAGAGSRRVATGPNARIGQSTRCCAIARATRPTTRSRLGTNSSVSWIPGEWVSGKWISGEWVGVGAGADRVTARSPRPGTSRTRRRTSRSASSPLARGDPWRQVRSDGECRSARVDGSAAAPVQGPRRFY